MAKAEKLLGIEDISDEIAKEHVEELYKLLKNNIYLKAFFKVIMYTLQ